MSNPTIVFDPYAAADLRNIVQTIVDNNNIALTGRAEWYPVAFFLKDERGEMLDGLLGIPGPHGYTWERSAWPLPCAGVALAGS